MISRGSDSMSGVLYNNLIFWEKMSVESLLEAWIAFYWEML